MARGESVIRIRKSDLILFSAPLLHVDRKAGRFVSPFTVFWSVVFSETVSPSGWSRIRFSILGVVVCGRGRGLGEIFVYSCSVFFYSLTTPSTPTSELQSFVVPFPGGGFPIPEYFPPLKAFLGGFAKFWGELLLVPFPPSIPSFSLERKFTISISNR